MSVFSSTALVASNKVAALIESVYKFQISEKVLDPQQDNIQITIDDDDNVITINGTLPISISSDADGDLVIQAEDITAVAVVPEGDVKSTYEASLVLEMFQMMVAAEDAEVELNPDFAPVTTLSVDSNTNLAAFATTIPYSSSLISGLPTLTATDFLS